MADELRIQEAARTLRDGGLVAFPTETVYGLGANAWDARAVAKIFEVKQRPLFNPLIVHVASLETASEVASEIPDLARVLATRFWPGPLTLVVPKRASVPDLVTAGLSTVAIRVPAHPIAQSLLREAGVPIAAPSANRFTSLSPTSAADVREALGEEVVIVLDGGPCSVGVESTIVGFGPTGRPRLLRTGGVPVEEIERLVGPVTLSTEAGDRPEAPGQLKRHYSPRTRLYFAGAPSGARVGLLTFGPAPDAANFAATEALSQSTDLREAAANLYGALRRLDRLGLDAILARPVPDMGLGRAINDRLKRASQ